MLQFAKITRQSIAKICRTWLPDVLSYCYFVALIPFAQDGIIKGVVKDGEIVLQSLRFQYANKTIVTNTDGEFSIQLKSGNYIQLLLLMLVIKKLNRTFTLKAGETQSLQFNMIREEQLGEVVVLGSRSLIQRSNLNTAVPVDRITSKELKQTGQLSLIQMMSFTVPSFNTSRQNLTEPVTLRGLGPDHLLILLNGTRYHNLQLI